MHHLTLIQLLLQFVVVNFLMKFKSCAVKIIYIIFGAFIYREQVFLIEDV